MEIRISFQSAIIVLLAVLVLVMGAYFYRGYHVLNLEKIVTEQKAFIQETQRCLLMLRVEPQVAKLFQEKGYKMNVIQTPLPELQQKEGKP